MTPPRSRPVLSAWLLLVALGGCKAAGEGVIALAGATLIDGSGGDPVHDALVLVKKGHIAGVARVNELQVPRGAQVVRDGQVLGTTPFSEAVPTRDRALVYQLTRPGYEAARVEIVPDQDRQMQQRCSIDWRPVHSGPSILISL